MNIMLFFFFEIEQKRDIVYNDMHAYYFWRINDSAKGKHYCIVLYAIYSVSFLFLFPFLSGETHFCLNNIILCPLDYDMSSDFNSYYYYPPLVICLHLHLNIGKQQLTTYIVSFL